MTWLLVLGILVFGGWALLSRFWAGSVQRFEPQLHDSVLRTRYGWRCPHCSASHTPNCGCGGPLFWQQQDTRIKCARCHRYLVAHPWLFQQLPRPRRRKCAQCNWSGTISNWKVT